MLKHYYPSNLQECLEILDKNDCYILAGGTDLMVQKHRSRGLLPNFDRDVVYVSHLKELHFIKEDEKEIHIGAAVKYIELLNSDIIPQYLKDVILEIASPQIRNMATLTGNIGNASPAGDSLPALYAFDARLVIQSLNNRREIALKDFILSVRKTDHKKEEIITEIIIPKNNLKYFWKKVGSRNSESISKVSFFGAYQVENGILKDLRIAFGSVSVTVVRNKEVENKYIGMKIDEFKAHLPEICEEYAKLIAPINDQRSTKEYREKVAINILKKFIRSIE